MKKIITFIVISGFAATAACDQSKKHSSLEKELWTAAKGDSIEKVRELIKKGANVNAVFDEMSVAEKTLDGFASDNDSGRAERQLKKLELLLNHGARFPCKFKDIFNLMGLKNLNEMEKRLPASRRCK